MEVDKVTKTAKEQHGVEDGQKISTEKLNEMKADPNLKVQENANGKVTVKEKLEE